MHRDCQETAVSLHITLPPSHHPPKAHPSRSWKEKHTSKAIQASALRAFVSFTWLNARCRQSRSTHCNFTSNFSTTFHVYMEYWVALYTKNQVYLPGSLHSLLGLKPAQLNSRPTHLSTRAQDLKNLLKCLWALDHLYHSYKQLCKWCRDVNAWFW